MATIECPVSGDFPPNMSIRFQECADDLKRFGISPDLGFVLANPLQSLPPYFEVWEKLARKTASLVEDGTLRAEIQKMPLLHHEHLQSHKELRLAHTCLTALVHGYVWMAGEQNIVSSIPMNLAVPVCGVSERLGIEPALRHYTFVLNNWTLRDSSRKLELSNVETIIKIRAGEDESWFFMVALQMELDAAPGMCAIVRAHQAVKGEEIKVLKDCLTTISASLSQVELALKRMHEQCRPRVFYEVLRPFLNGWNSNAFTLKGLQGLIYEGVSPHPRAYAGGSGAQSAILFAFDAALGVTQSNSVYKKFFNMLCPAHKEFVEAVRNGPSIQSYVLRQNSDELYNVFNSAVRALQHLRSYHLQIATRYIVIQSNSKDKNKAFSNLRKTGTGGTGGTEFMQFLKGLRDCTKEAVLNDI